MSQHEERRRSQYGFFNFAESAADVLSVVLPLEAREGPEAADPQDVAVDADAFLFLVEIGVAFGLGGESVVFEKQSALETSLLEIGKPAAHMTGTGDQGDMR